MAGAFATRMGLYVANQLSLRARIAVDVALSRFDGSMTREQLHIAEAASRTMNIASGDGDETAPTRMRGTAFEAEFLEQRHEPIDDAVRLHVRAAIGADDRSDGLRGLGQPLQCAPQIRMHRDPPTAP